MIGRGGADGSRPASCGARDSCARRASACAAQRRRHGSRARTPERLPRLPVTPPPRGKCLALELASLCYLFRREQTPPCTAVSLHVGVGVILTARAPNRRRSSRAFGGRMTQGRARETQGRENGHDHIARHRPRGATDRRRRILLQTQGLSRTGCRRSWQDRRPHTSRVYDRPVRR
jgi:hypothetical protein